MRIHRLYITNLTALRGEHKINFEELTGGSGLVAITGPTGSGKTTLLDAICLALYGQVPRQETAGRGTNPAELMSTGTAHTVVELEFECMGQRYCARWAVQRAHKRVTGELQDPTRSLAVWDVARQEFVQMESQIRAVNNRVVEITGLTYDQFTKAILLPQGAFKKFLEADKKEKTQLLAQITGATIYDQITRRTKDLYDIENKKLDALKARLEGLQLLSEEEELQITADLAVKTAEVAARQDELKTLQAQAQVLAERDKLLQLAASASRALETAQQAWHALEAEREQWQRHEKALLLDRELAVLNQLQNSLSELETRLPDLRVKAGQLEASVEQADKDQRSAEQQYLAAKEALKEAAPTIDAVKRLETQRTDLREQYRAASDAHKRLQAEKTTAETALAQTSEGIEKAKTALSSVQQYLADNATDATLENNLELIKGKLTHRQTLLEEQARQQAAQTRLATHLAKAELELEKASNALTTDSEQVSVLTDQKEKAEEDLAAMLAGQTLAEVTQQAIEARDRHQQVVQWHEAHQRYIAAQAQWQQLQLQLEPIRLKKQEADAELAETDKLIADLQRDNLALQLRPLLAGEEHCPACGAHHSHFDLEAVASVESRVATQLEQRKAQLAAQVDQITTAVQQAEQDIASAFTAVNLYRQDLIRKAEAAGGLDTDDVPDVQTAQHDFLVKEKRTQQAQLLDNQLRRQTVALQAAQDGYHSRKLAHQQLQSELSQIKLGQEQVGKFLGEQAVAIAHAEAELNQLVGDRAYRPAHDRLLPFLEKKKTEFQAQLQAKERLDSELKDLGLAEARHAEAIKALAAQLEDQDKACAALRTQGVTVNSEIKALLPADRDTARDWQTALEQSVASSETAFSKASSALGELKQAWAKAQISLKSDEAAQQRTQAALLEAIAAADTKAVANGFANGQDAAAARLDETSAASLQQRLNTVDKARVEATTLDLEARKNLSTFQAEHPEDTLPDATEVAQLLGDLEVSLKTTSEEIGSLKQQLATNKVQQKQAADLNNQRKEQAEVTEVYRQLHDLFGTYGPSGTNKLQAFVQSLTLRILLTLANQRLQGLNPRYQLAMPDAPDEKQELQFEVIDLYQANTRRSITTLSGGESFLVSLALALALSDLAGQRAQLDTLFIDEGFGTLDSDSLETAMSALDSLQASGKLVGLISHVGGIKDRIGTRIELVRSGHGASKLRFVRNGSALDPALV